MICQSLLEKRRKKILSLCLTRKMEENNRLLKGLEIKQHLDGELFSGRDLRAAEKPVMMDNSLADEKRLQDVNLGFEGVLNEDGRIIGRFVSANVVNLSRRSLSEEEIILLSQGLKFSPVPTDIDVARLRQDIEDFKRRIRIRWFFKDRTNDATAINKFKLKSSWNRPKGGPLLESYLSLVEKRVLSVSAEGKSYPNLSHSELSALKFLKSDVGLVIREADMGSALVLLDRGEYVTEAVLELDDRQVYEEVEVDPTVELGKTILDRLKELREEDLGLEEVMGYLEVNDSRLSRFYLLPKIHKVLNSVMGRPVISNCGSITEHISGYLDHHFNPLISFTRSYVQDTNHFLSKLGKLGSIPDWACLCIVDVIGRYLSMPHGEGLEAIREALGRRVNPTVATATCIGLASLVLENNYFEFNNKIYRQELRSTIGTNFAPAYANLFMSVLDERL